MLKNQEKWQNQHENLAGYRRDETLLSSVLSNGYIGDESSFNKSENEYATMNLSDSEVVSPMSKHSLPESFCCGTSIHLDHNQSLEKNSKHIQHEISKASRDGGVTSAMGGRGTASVASNSSTTSASVASNSSASGTDILCSWCNTLLAGKVPFHNYKYCSSSCMHPKNTSSENIFFLVDLTPDLFSNFAPQRRALPLGDEARCLDTCCRGGCLGVDLGTKYRGEGDEASILGGAINYVKELEEELQVLCAKNSTANLLQDVGSGASDGCRGYQLSTPSGDHIQVTMDGENHVDLKLHSKWRPKLLPRFISQIESLMLTVLHFNLSRADQFVLCSLSLKVEDGSKYTSVKRIATVVNGIMARIQEEDERV
nr:transcription factor bHLH96-like [Ipomoea batatas]